MHGWSGSVEGEIGHDGEAEEEEREWERTLQTPWPRRLLRAYFRVADMWARAILSNPTTVACAIRGEKGGVEIEASLPYPV